MAHDTDAFNRWEAGQTARHAHPAARASRRMRAGQAVEVPRRLRRRVRRVLRDGPRDPAFAAEACRCPSETYLAEQMDVVDPDAIHAVRTSVLRELGRTLRTRFAGRYPPLHDARTLFSPMPRRRASGALRNLALGYLMELESTDAYALVRRAVRDAPRT